jgi:predicted DNA-binding protein with PD1-like motif
MSSRKLDIGRNFIVRAKYNSDMITFLNNVARKHGITNATFTVIGALKSAKLGFYDQDKHEYLENLLSTPQEIATCVGNISTKEGEPFVHAHAVLADRNGNTKGGHLFEGRVFAAEVHLFELIGEKIVRRNDTVTGLSLWDI